MNTHYTLYIDLPCQPGESFMGPFRYQMVESLFHSSASEMDKELQILRPSSELVHCRKRERKGEGGRE